jgi:hypothetical protein
VVFGNKGLSLRRSSPEDLDRLGATEPEKAVDHSEEPDDANEAENVFHGDSCNLIADFPAPLWAC